MILCRQRKRKSTHFLHTTAEGGYSPPPFKNIAKAYGIGYNKESCDNITKIGELVKSLALPCILELTVPETADISPYIPFGNHCDDFVPPTKDEDKKRIEKILHEI
jgi:hypothetical protein